MLIPHVKPGHLFTQDTTGTDGRAAAEGSEEPVVVMEKKQTLPVSAPWVQACNWSEDVQMRYQMMPKRKEQVLEEDRAALARMSQSIDVVDQLTQLRQYIKNTDSRQIIVSINCCPSVMTKSAPQSRELLIRTSGNELQLISWNYGQLSMSIARYWVDPVIWMGS